MGFLLVHTRYRQPGGEEAVFEAEQGLLRRMGHEVMVITLENRELEGTGPWRQAAATLWNQAAYRRVREAVREFRPGLAHFHNTFPFASPAVVRAVSAEGVPVVMTLHNYRLQCVNALFFRGGRVCEDCLGRLPWRGVVYGCYGNSRAASAVVGAMLTLHRRLGTWGMVDRYIALTEFARQKFLQAGIPPGKLVVKPNFVYPDPGVGQGGGGYALFVGRLVPEKGILTLLRAWKDLGRKLPLKIVGDGPLSGELRRAAQASLKVEWLGQRAQEEVYGLMGDAEFLIFPSEWYEGLPRVVIEAMARGLPVVASALGSQGTLVEHGRTGLLFRPGDADDLAEKVAWLLDHPEEVMRMRREARAEYEAKYTAERNYELLMNIYREVSGGSR